MKSMCIRALVIGVLLLVGCENGPGRYQMVVTPPFEGDYTNYAPRVYVCDTRTGAVYYKARNDMKKLGIEKMDPVNYSITWSPLTKTPTSTE